MTFRLPVPPAWDDRPPRAWAAHRRARRAYFAALDALATGQVHAEQVAKLHRLCAELRRFSGESALEHLLRVFSLVRRRGARAVIARPAAPLETVVITVPGTAAGLPPEALRQRYAWSLEWMRTRRVVVGRGLAIEWRVAATPAAPAREARERRPPRVLAGT